MTREHIVVLKKIPVDPHHIEALRLGGARQVPPLPTKGEHHKEHHEEYSHGRSSSGFFRAASFALFLTFLTNPVLVAYAEEGTLTAETSAPTETSAEPAQPQPGTTVIIPSDEGGGESMLEGIPPSTDGIVPADGAVGEGAPPSESESEASPEEGSGEGVPEDPVGEGGTQNEESSGAQEVTDTATTTGTTTGVIPVGEEEASSTDSDGTLGTTTETGVDASALPLESGTSTEEDTGGVLPEEEDHADPEMTLEREPTPEERAADRAAAEAAMREQIRGEVEAEIRATCVSYGDDGYYCLDKNSAQRISEARPVERVISENTGGDKEIVLVRTLPEGETREAITQNDIDDEFPNADGAFRLIVWQSLISGRWQISYKEGTSSIAYLTVGGNGNGHPVTDGRNIVWQSWTGDQWDIFLAQPRVEGTPLSPEDVPVLEGVHPGWTVRKLSENLDHDMFPKIAGSVVTWQEHHGDRWAIAVHDLVTGATRSIEPEAGGTGEDPTIALLYKERTPDGRVAMRARDIATGEAIPLRTDELPELPAKLPIPEQQGALPAQAGTSTTTVLRPEGEGDDPTPEI